MVRGLARSAEGPTREAAVRRARPRGRSSFDGGGSQRGARFVIEIVGDGREHVTAVLDVLPRFGRRQRPSRIYGVGPVRHADAVFAAARHVEPRARRERFGPEHPRIAVSAARVDVDRALDAGPASELGILDVDAAERDRGRAGARERLREAVDAIPRDALTLEKPGKTGYAFVPRGTGTSCACEVAKRTARRRAPVRPQGKTTGVGVGVQRIRRPSPWRMRRRRSACREDGRARRRRRGPTRARSTGASEVTGRPDAVTARRSSGRTR